MNERQKAKQMVKELPFKDKIKHFWYYYRSQTIVILALLLLIGGTVYSKLTAVKYDLQISCYTARYVEDERLERICDMAKQVVSDIHGNNSVDVNILPYAADISAEYLDQVAQAALTKLTMEFEAYEHSMYLVDQVYMELFQERYSDIVQTSVEVTNIPEFREILMPMENERFYVVVIQLFDRVKDEKLVVDEHRNAEIFCEHIVAMSAK